MDYRIMNIFEKIHDSKQFRAYHNYERTLRGLDSFIERERIEEVKALDFWDIGSHKENERWFKEKETGIIYRLIPPDYPFCGVWENITTPPPKNQEDYRMMNIFEKIYNDDVFRAYWDYDHTLKRLDSVIKKGTIEEVTVLHFRGRGFERDERWFREKETGITYRLIPPDYPFCGIWEEVK